MGLFNVELQVGDADGTRFESVSALAGAGATFTIVPAEILSALGVERSKRGEFELADGSLRSFDLGETRVRVNGGETNSVVVFGEGGMQPILGAVTLEILGLAVAPARKRLIQVPWRLL